MTKFEISSIKQRKAEDEALFVSGGLGDDRDYDRDDGGGSDGEGGGTVGDDASHSKLLTDIIKLNKNKRREAKRSVRTSSLGGAPIGVDTDRLLKRLESTKLNKSVPRLTTLDTPVEKTLARKAKRAAGFEKVAIESEKWARLVDRRRKAEQVSFPLQRPDLRYSQVEKVEQQQYKPKTSLEEKVFGLLQGAKLVEQKVETKEEQAARRAMSLQELKERNRELWREREMRRRYEHKAMMHNKSKSRKHHRLLRRDKLKQQRSEMEELQRKDPEAALGVLQDLERARVEERMSLRHKKSKWAHLQGPRATRDKQAMAALKENQRMHRELTAKVDKPAMEEEEDDDDDDTIKKMEEMLKERAVAIESGTYDPMNPWTNNLAQPPGEGPAGGTGGTGGEAQEEDQSYTKFVKFWDEFNQRKAFDKKLEEEMERREEEEMKEEQGEEEEEEEDEDDDDDGDYEDIETEEEEEVKKVEPKKKGNTKNKNSGLKTKKATTKLKKGKENKGKEKVIKKGKCEQEEEEKEDDDDDDDEDYEDIEEDEEVNNIEPKKKGNKKSPGVEAKKATIKLKKGKGKKKVIKKGKENVIKNGECEEAKKGKKGKLVKLVVEEEKGPEEKTTKKKKITKKQALNLKVTELDITVQTKKKKAQSLDASGVKISPIKTNQQKKTSDPGNNPTQKSTKKKKMESIKITSIETPKTKLNKVEVTSIQTPPKIKLKKVEVTSTETPPKTKLNKVEVTSTETPKTKLNKKSPKGKPVVNSVEVPQTETATSIVDELFDEAEEGIKRTVKRKLEKLGITAEANQTWTKITRKKKKPLEKEKPVMVEEYDFTTTHNAENIDETLERNVQLEESEGADRNTDKGKGALEKAFNTLKNGTDEDANNNNNKNKNNKTQDNKKAGKYANVDPTKFIQVSTKKLVTSLPDTVAGGEEGLDDSEEEEEGGRPGGGEEEEEDPEDVIREAFADDYLIDEFNSEKKAAIAKDKLAPLSLALPGWGDWAGPNIKMSKNKMKRYRMNAPKEVRKDSNIGNVIYNETADVHDNLRSAMVNDLPYPFKSVKDFEASVRAPIGRMFVPETTHKKLTMPALTTRLGTVIDPMTEDQLLRTKHAGTVKTKEQSNREKAKRERQEREKEELSKEKSKSGGGVKRKRNWNRKK